MTPELRLNPMLQELHRVPLLSSSDARSFSVIRSFSLVPNLYLVVKYSFFFGHSASLVNFGLVPKLTAEPKPCVIDITSAVCEQEHFIDKLQ